MATCNTVAAASPAKSNSPRFWGVALRPTFLFVTAFALNSTPHEAVHAITAHFLGFSSTLHQIWVDPDTATASVAQDAIIAVVGPLFSLVLGLTCWIAYRWRYRRSPAGLCLLMLGTVGIYSFLGPLAGSALGGAFHTALISIRTPNIICDVASVCGFLLLPVFMYFIGKELVRWTPSGSKRAAAVVSTTVAPWLAGTALSFALYWPLPKILIGPILTGSVFWFSAVLGAIRAFPARKPVGGISSFIAWDIVLAAAAVTMVRLLVRGIRLSA